MGCTCPPGLRISGNRIETILSIQSTYILFIIVECIFLNHNIELTLSLSRFDSESAATILLRPFPRIAVDAISWYSEILVILPASTFKWRRPAKAHSPLSKASLGPEAWLNTQNYSTPQLVLTKFTKSIQILRLLVERLTRHWQVRVAQTKVKAKAPVTDNATAGFVAIPSCVMFNEAQTWHTRFSCRKTSTLNELGSGQLY